MKKRNVYGKKMTQVTRRHKYPVTIHYIAYDDGVCYIIKEYHCGKYFLFLSNDDFSELLTFAHPITKRYFNALLNEYVMRDYIVSWFTEVIA